MDACSKRVYESEQKASKENFQRSNVGVYVSAESASGSFRALNLVFSISTFFERIINCQPLLHVVDASISWSVILAI